jgi:hypothetical protein
MRTQKYCRLNLKGRILVQSNCKIGANRKLTPFVDAKVNRANSRLEIIHDII